MFSVQFVQVNPRNLNETIEKINSTCVGFEVTEPQIIELLDINIDPQHTGVKQFDVTFPPENKSAALFVLGVLPTIDPTNQEIYVLPSKLDIDAIAAATLWLNAPQISSWENDPEKHQTFLNLCQRVKEIDTMDCGLGSQGIEWNPDYFSQQLIREITPFNVLGCMCSDFKCDILVKLTYMFDWLAYGNLPTHYRKQVESEMSAQKESIIDVFHGVTFVQSESRGISNLIYSTSPYGVAFNPSFPTPNGTIRKFTIMQFGTSYLDLQAILDELNKIEKETCLLKGTWGGNLQAGVIGSPFSGTALYPEQVCEIVARHIKN